MPIHILVSKGTWGGILPEGPLRITVADPFDACTPLINEDLEGAVVLVARGVCGFGDKAINIQVLIPL